MKRFDYEAKDLSTGKIVKASVQAESENAAAKLLLSQGFTPHNIQEAGENRSLLARLTGRITTKDRVVFTRQLATLIGAGLPLTQSLRTVHDQTENKQFQAVLDDVIASVEGGKSLADSFSQHKNVFDTIFLALVKAGEASGTLDQSLRRIAAQQEKDAAVMSKIRGALTYPIIVLVVILGVVVFMLVTVVPQVERLYEDLHQTLPFLTQILVSLATVVRLYGWLLIIIAGIGIYFLIQFLKTDTGIRWMDTFKLNVPLFKGMFRRLYMARFTRTGQTLLATGVAMLDMLEIAKESVNNTLIGEDIGRAAEKVRGGKSLSSSLQNEAYILPLVAQMISIGEQSGKIDEMMGKTAQVYEDELDEEIRTISTAIEPILMVVLAIVAGGMVAAILLPIYSLVNTIRL
ncbi:pilin biogenesis protein [Candidatus Saccharibacteria bacterium RAAC3_TM7_1]|nr:pilin biogenesis protein [Candidatus Saccharibacteria bacterium RAAC3_TM7_1]HCZ28162.1 type II secretion system F family protein [Candidatus Saccharibacteria bacterium]